MSFEPTIEQWLELFYRQTDPRGFDKRVTIYEGLNVEQQLVLASFALHATLRLNQQPAPDRVWRAFGFDSDKRVLKHYEAARTIYILEKS